MVNGFQSRVRFLFWIAACLILLGACTANHTDENRDLSNSEVKLVPVSSGYADTSVNTVIFRKHSLFTHKENQFIAFYDSLGHVVVGKRALTDTSWTLHTTGFSGNVEDAHNSISLAVDGKGYMHLSWDHHNNSLRYAKSLKPGGLEMGEESRPGSLEADHSVTYPEFYRLPDGDLILMYRNGWSGEGSQVVHRFDTERGSWELFHEQLIDGGGEVNPYWQTSMDENGTFHLSWTWRRHGGVETNHDIMYARSADGGKSWERSDGTSYKLPITPETAEVAANIPENSSLMNQTSMAADVDGRPYIVNYWTPEDSNIPQYHLVYHNGEQWKSSQISRRSQPFELSGEGTMAPPISRPQIVTGRFDGRNRVFVIFRDEERGNRVSVAVSDDLASGDWRVKDLTLSDLGAWEPTLDHQLWRDQKKLNLFVQRVGQGDHERSEEIGPQMIYVLEWDPEVDE